MRRVEELVLRTIHITHVLDVLIQTMSNLDPWSKCLLAGIRNSNALGVIPGHIFQISFLHNNVVCAPQVCAPHSVIMPVE